MSSDDDRDYLADMLLSARLAVSYVRDMTFATFRADQKTQDAVVYRVGVIGEAARSLSDTTRNNLPLDWPGIIV